MSRVGMTNNTCPSLISCMKNVATMRMNEAELPELPVELPVGPKVAKSHSCLVFCSCISRFCHGHVVNMAELKALWKQTSGNLKFTSCIVTSQSFRLTWLVCRFSSLKSHNVPTKPYTDIGLNTNISNISIFLGSL